MSSIEKIVIKAVNTLEGGMMYTVTANPMDSVGQLKAGIKQLAPSIDTSILTLSFNGKILEDKDILALVGMKQGSKVSMGIQVKAG